MPGGGIYNRETSSNSASRIFSVRSNMRRLESQDNLVRRNSVFHKACGDRALSPIVLNPDHIANQINMDKDDVYSGIATPPNLSIVILTVIVIENDLCFHSVSIDDRIRDLQQKTFNQGAIPDILVHSVNSHI